MKKSQILVTKKNKVKIIKLVGVFFFFCNFVRTCASQIEGTGHRKLRSDACCWSLWGHLTVHSMCGVMKRVNTTSVTMWNCCFGWNAPRRCCLYATSKREVEQLVCYLKPYSTNANARGFQHKGRLFVESSGDRHGWVWVQLTQPQPLHCVPRAGIKPLTFSRWGDSAKHCTTASPEKKKL